MMLSFQNMNPSHSRLHFVLCGFLCLTMLSVGLSGCSDDSGDESSSNNNSEEETLPADFPSNVPIYEPSELVTVSGGDTAYIVGFTSPDSADDVLAFYLSELKSNGWTHSAKEGDSRFNASNSNTDSDLVVHVITTSGQTVITLTAYL